MPHILLDATMIWRSPLSSLKQSNKERENNFNITWNKLLIKNQTKQQQKI